MSTILEVAPGLTVIWDNGEITSTDPWLADYGRMIRDTEGPRAYWPHPPEGWAKAMQKHLPRIRVLQMDPPPPEAGGEREVVY